MQSLTR